MVDNRVWEELKSEAHKLRKEYARLRNKPKPFETEDEKDVREMQLDKDNHEKSEEFDSLRDDFKKKRNYVLELRKEVEFLKLRERKDELEQKLKDQTTVTEKTITEKELLELHILNSYYTSESVNEEKRKSLSLR